MAGVPEPFRLETERLVLRSWREEDAVPFAAMNRDRQVMAHLDGPIDRTASDEVIVRICATEAEQGNCFWAVERKADRTFIGFCGLRRGGHAGTPVVDELEIGWRLAHHAWGQGFAREAAEASLQWGFAHREAPRIVAWTVPANTASWGLMTRLGMMHRPDLDFDHPRFPAGHPLCRHLVYVMERDIWLSKCSDT
ncbi:GNAT family N-acetyltransferase [Novosphingobium naphthalenivorans]|uniref:GNAT family N-acetyltransferase n=1 Tax=Novosphingobium naphthalenivorans TaxID=273168 RepID=UPI00082C0E9B|nr:GNAT family N-acetyltransferase [Novosphingobium naphthalenivorans]